MLVVEDEASIASFVSLYLKNAGYTVRTASTGSEALSQVAAEQPGLIVLDLHQAIDGRDLLTSLKADPLTRDIKVVMLSGEESQLTRHDCFKLGAEDYFVKPLDPLFFRRISKIAGVEAAH